MRAAAKRPDIDSIFEQSLTKFHEDILEREISFISQLSTFYQLKLTVIPIVWVRVKTAINSLITTLKKKETAAITATKVNYYSDQSDIKSVFESRCKQFENEILENISNVLMQYNIKPSLKEYIPEYEDMGVAEEIKTKLVEEIKEFSAKDLKTMAANYEEHLTEMQTNVNDLLLLHKKTISPENKQKWELFKQGEMKAARSVFAIDKAMDRLIIHDVIIPNDNNFVDYLNAKMHSEIAKLNAAGKQIEKKLIMFSLLVIPEIPPPDDKVKKSL